LVLTGDGPIQRDLVRRYARPGITFTGWKRGEELAMLFASADIFALPSTTETLSLVSLESMASGVPILGMNAGGIRDIIEHQRTGLLANSSGEFDAFLRLLIEGVALRKGLGLNGRRYAEGKTWACALENLERSYQELLSGTGESTG
jgi:glycosyltransferase involved in cell wall biosynthesis